MWIFLWRISCVRRTRSVDIDSHGVGDCLAIVSLLYFYCLAFSK
jgi:hypothetical protein